MVDSVNADYKWIVYRNPSGKIGVLNSRGEAIIRPGFDA